MNRQTIRTVIMYQQKFCLPEMSLDERADIIFKAWHLLNQTNNPMMATQETVNKVWRECGFKLRSAQQELEGLVGARIT